MPILKKIMEEIPSEIGEVFEQGLFKHYEVRHARSRGAGLRVFEAWDTVLQRPVHIAYFDCEDAHQLQYFLIRARKFSALSDPAFLQIHAIEELHDGLIIVHDVNQKSGRWRSLKTCMDDASTTSVQIRKWMLQAAQALSALHRAGLQDTDVRISHFYVDQHECLRLVDLGLQLPASFETIAVLDQVDANSDFAYLAPERFSHVSATASSDVYTLGLIFYVCLLGRFPHENLRGLALVAALTQNHSEQWAWTKELPDAMRRLVIAMTAQTACERISADEVVIRLKAIGLDNPTSEHMPDLNPSNLVGDSNEVPNSKPKRLGRLALLLLVVFVILISLGLALQSKIVWPKLVDALTPYSATRELDEGLKALNFLDQSQQFELAATHFARILERDPNDASAVAAMSIVYSLRFNSERKDDIWRQKANSSAQRALELNPSLPLTQIAQAFVLAKTQQTENAQMAIAKALAIEPRNQLAWRFKVRILVMDRRYEDALNASDEGLKLFPDDWYLYDLRGLASFILAKHDEAENAFRRSLNLHPNSSVVYGHLAGVLQEKGDLAEALRVLQKGLEISPNGHLYASLGEVKTLQSDFLGAVSAFEKALSPVEGNPQDYSNWLGLADALIWIPAKKMEAIEAYRKAQSLIDARIHLNPNDGWLLAIKAKICARLGDRKLSETLILKSLSLASKNREVHFLAAVSHEILGDRDAALNEIDRAIDLGYSTAFVAMEPVFRELRRDVRYKVR